MNRRQALISFAVGIASANPLPVWAQTKIDGRQLSVVADIYLPSDFGSPAASEIGVVEELVEILSANPLLERLIASGLDWLDQVHGVPFETLPLEIKEQTLLAIAETDFNQGPGRFYHVLRLLLFEIYFSKPQALAGLKVNDTPQPAGYLPPWT